MAAVMAFWMVVKLVAYSVVMSAAVLAEPMAAW